MEQMTITLSPQATAAYLKQMRSKTEAEVEAAVEPTGARLLIDIDMFESSISLHSHGKYKHLGEVEMDFIKEP